ncbi:DCC1-like thiol-disulfide oxidoreductase family protein [Leptospira sp. 2 VSF19]|uniref:DCC1-like thiol-disulfide oxidoreductase family protein n=1 Tax=Leptospira soteropolitanensis TaxID=2950025 RepID=A0AAW5VMC8_9LEPT|nr:DCC1-like thiol-disulfide oxidoreductase family protein [Leptospira soteropolitanensis]MCW7493895.1 DCC1-like thiol-disulfide oxidoreductase family protein [Leptospira soteropolitanensis]MCW7501489.1 DCC1-like thiol-disulfide oxidoreductase family protein [Leptospira soteropolitanensis]MCW7523748.1 DCC1-like thiol-disulfide oxidoreductase family protein [Leptospira soteropolitanensis]MCW7527612.1 DCC1-like thiol-disulfide oxidoreductase family protein [Leptospira soteropolitanensis]MCW75314
MPPEKSKIVFFDGVCHLCMGSVQFLLKHNQKENLYFSAIGSDVFHSLIPENRIPNLPDSILYWSAGKLYLESDAILQIVRELKFPWFLFFGFWMVPRIFRNAIYRFIAKHRYQWFGKADSCMVPSPNIKKRFLD